MAANRTEKYLDRSDACRRRAEAEPSGSMFQRDMPDATEQWRQLAEDAATLEQTHAASKRPVRSEIGLLPAGKRGKRTAPFRTHRRGAR